MGKLRQLDGRAAQWQRALLLSEPYSQSGSRSARDWLVDSVLFVFAAVLGGLALGGLWHSHGEVLDAVDLVFGVLACLALWTRRSRPVVVVAAVAAAAFFSPLALGAALVAICTAASRARGRALIPVALLAVAGSVVFPLVNPAAGAILKPAFPAFLLTVAAFGWGCSPAPAGAGRLPARAGRAAGGRQAAQRRAGARRRTAAHRPGNA